MGLPRIPNLFFYNCGCPELSPLFLWANMTPDFLVVLSPRVHTLSFSGWKQIKWETLPVPFPSQYRFLSPPPPHSLSAFCHSPMPLGRFCYLFFIFGTEYLLFERVYERSFLSYPLPVEPAFILNYQIMAAWAPTEISDEYSFTSVSLLAIISSKSGALIMLKNQCWNYCHVVFTLFPLLYIQWLLSPVVKLHHCHCLPCCP